MLPVKGKKALAARPAGRLRFAWLCDSHVTVAVNPVQRRVLAWVSRQLRDRAVAAVVLGGDITHQADAGQTASFCKFLRCRRLPLYFLPGNNEGTDPAVLAVSGRLMHAMRGCVRLPWPGHVFALGVTDASGQRDAVKKLASLLPARGTALVMSHFPPAAAGPAALGMLQRPGLRLHWICGHLHRGRDYNEGSIKTAVCAGLDPVKARGSPPEIMVGDWDGKKLILQRRRVPPALLASPSRRPGNPLGLAFRASPAAILRSALATGVETVQFDWRDMPERMSVTARALVARFRGKFSKSMISLRLPPLPACADGISLAEADVSLSKAAVFGVDNLTVRLPAVPASWMYDDGKHMRDTPWVKSCRNVVLQLAERALAMQAGLCLENIRNSVRVAPEHELLSSRPWHLLRFVEWLRETLRARGRSRRAAGRIGVVFNTGHAFSDPVVSKMHGLGDWIARLAPFIHMIYLHQVVFSAGVYRNHLAVNDVYGPFINHAGLLPLIRATVPRRVPLLLEVNDRAGAMKSRRILASVRA